MPDVLGSAFVFVLNFLGYILAKNLQNCTKSDKDILKMKKVNFLRHSAVVISGAFVVCWLAADFDTAS